MLFALPICFSLNVSASLRAGEIAFLVEGQSATPVNLTLFVVKDGVQLRGMQKEGVLLPYYFYFPQNGSGTYELRVIDDSGQRADGNITIAPKDVVVPPADTQKTEQQGMEFAIIAALAGIAVLVYLLLRFLNTKSYSK